MQSHPLTVLAMAVALAASLPVAAQTAGAVNPPGTAGVSSTNAAPAAAGKASAGSVAAADRTFMLKAAGSGMYEVQASKMVAERASSQEVKDFAQTMVSDHEKANQELMALASARSVTLPPEMPADKRKELDRLSKSSKFDADYMRETGVKEHKAAVALFEKASKSSQDAELKAWAAEKLPTLREHLAHAQKIKPGSGGASAQR